MSNKRVAGTIMLHLRNGSKKFLMHSNEEDADFPFTEISGEATGLASILRFFNDVVEVGINDIQLVELTNAHFHNENIPLFVFETSEEFCEKELAEGYIWEEPSKLRDIFSVCAIEGVPFF